VVWVGIALTALFGGWSPAGMEIGPVRRDGECRLGVPGEAPACSCDELDARTRLALGMPVALAGLGSAELELVDGIGPARAASIAAESLRSGPFGSPEELARRVPGIGPATAARLAAQLGGRAGAGCELR
jgi:hypothetical protein